jgi:hypothetical protein
MLGQLSGQKTQNGRTERKHKKHKRSSARHFSAGILQVMQVAVEGQRIRFQSEPEH